MKKRLSLVAFCVITLCPQTAIHASYPGDVDGTFQTGALASNNVRDMVGQRDGKLVVVGLFTAYDGFARNRIVRLLANGGVDLSFNPAGGFNNDATAVALQADGKIIVGGVFTSFNGTSSARLLRLNADGSLDLSFKVGLGPASAPSRILIQRDGKVLVAGSFTSFNGSPVERLVRLEANGQIDTSFATTTAANGQINDMALQADGKLLISGAFSTYKTVPRSRLARVNPDGSLDTTFVPSVDGASPLEAVTVTRSGRILIGGNFTSYGSIPRVRIARLLDDGSLDNTFDPGVGPDQSVTQIQELTNGKVMIAGSFITVSGTSQSSLARLNANGSLDTAFDSSTVEYSLRRTLVLAGNRVYTNVSRGVIAVNGQGKVDAAFGAERGANSEVGAVAQHADGKVVIAGSFTAYEGQSRAHVARLLPNGRLDLSFNPGVGASDFTTCVAVQSDGKILLGGAFNSFAGVSCGRYVRLNPNGTVDAGFSISPGANDDVTGIAVQADGKILIIGTFSDVQGHPRSGIARLNANGSLDSTFTPGTGFSGGRAAAVAIQSDGKVVVGGFFSSYNGTGRNGIARLLNTGAIDPSFNPGTGTSGGGIQSLALQANGSILIAGSFTSYNGVGRNRVARVISTGGLDTSFFPGIGPNGPAYSVLALPGGRVLIGGQFDSCSGVDSNGLARLLPNGQLDRTFRTTPASGADVYCALHQPDGRVVIGGDFNAYGGGRAANLVRLHNEFSFTRDRFSGRTFTEDGSHLELFGGIDLAITAAGAWSGNWRIGTESVRLRGQWDAFGQANQQIRRRDGSLSLLSISLARDANGQAMVTGQIEAPGGKVVKVEAVAAFFAVSKLPANHYAGTYNAYFSQPSSPGVFAGALPPSGFGYVSLQVDSRGQVRAVGRASDGSVLTSSSLINADGSTLLHWPLYRRNGFLSGRIEVAVENVSPVIKPVTGLFIWNHPGGVSAYPNGFAQPLIAIGGRYLPAPVSTSPFGDLAPGSVVFTASGGHLPVPGGVNLLNFALNGVGLIDNSVLEQLKVRINRRTGLISGSFVVTGGSRPVKIQGLIDQQVSGGIGSTAHGFSLIPQSGLSLPSGLTFTVPLP